MDKHIEIERIVHPTLSGDDVMLAVAGVQPIVYVTLEEYKAQFPNDPELRDVDEVKFTRTMSRDEYRKKFQL